MAIKSIMDLNKDLRTTLNNVPALIDTLEKGFAGINDEISSGAEPNKATNSFNTINGGLLSECKVALSPNQDLHGYPEPWVGGAGKNKLDISSGTPTDKAYYQDNKIIITGGTYSNFVTPTITITEAGSITFSTDITVTSGTLNYAIIKNGTQVAEVSATSSGKKTATINNLAVDDEILIRLRSTDNGQGYFSECQVELGSTATTYEPWDNICPISGHTQVEVDVSDGQTTQEQVTVALGNTYYSGVLDVVSGVLTVDSAYIESYDGESLPSTWISDRDAYAPGTTPTSGAEVIYKLATPTTVQLSPTTVKALAGVNYITAPSDGQEIVEVEYKEIFTFEDVEKAIDNAVASVYPASPATDGSYVLTLVKDGTSITRSWVSTEP